MKGKRKFFGRIVSFLTVFALTIPTAAQLSVSAEETEKYPYSLFGRNGITMTATSNMCINGAVHTNKEAEVSASNKNINGKLTTGNDIEKRVKHVYADTKIYENYFTENCDLYEEEYVYSELNIHINNPLFCYNNITLNGNVSLNSNLGTYMNLNVTGEVKNANTSVVYSKYGNITIENDSTANINGLIYAPLGTVTINSPNVTINGVIIADKVVINSSNVNINYNDNIARFIGTVSEAYDFSGLEYLPEEWLGDTDEDELFDIYEKVIDTDPLDVDTDDDCLPDGYEVLTLNTDPLEMDTDENGISDADEDFDTDNLNNLGEYQNGTQPYNPDTDEDGFLDGDEVNKYKTEPLNPDTDEDGLLDGEESYDGSIYAKYKVYFDPVNPDTDGDGILDGDEVFGQKKQQTVETHDEAITEIIVDMDTNGNLERNLTIESMYDIDAMSSNVYALIGEPFNFETPTSFNSAKITFKVDKTKLGDTKFDNLLILWYNEEEQIFEEMETFHDEANSTVSTTTTHFSQYMIVDSEKWFANWERSFEKLCDMWIGNTTYQQTMNTIFIVDCSSDMKTAPYGNSRLSICSNIINNMLESDEAAVITYSNTVGFSMGFNHPQAILYSLRNNISSSGDSRALVSAFDKAMNMIYSGSADKYRIIILTSSKSEFTSKYEGKIPSNVIVNAVNLGSYDLGESIYKIANVYTIATADELTYQYGDEVYIPPQFIGKDSDGDGIPDLVEECGLLPNGQPLGTSSLLKDTDGDGIPDNEEFNISMDKLTYEINKEQYVNAIYAKSHPNEIDTDGDKLWDNCDPKPQNKHNNGESLELSSGNDGTIAQLQHWLVALGYLNMHDNPYGQNYGPITRTAVYIYQMNHGFQSTVITNGKETAIKNIDDLTYATIANDFANNFGNGEEDYLNYVEGISDKPYFNSIETTCPTVSEAQSACGVKVIKKDNSTIKANYANTFDLYFYDYTEPLNTKMNENLLYLLHLSYLYENTETESSIASMMAVEFFNNVKPYGDWDYKIQTSWEKAFKDIPYMSISFPFILRENFCSAEKFGNVNYGYVGKAIGFSEDILINFGHVVSLVTSKQFEGEDDLNNVRKGFEYYDKDVK